MEDENVAKENTGRRTRSGRKAAAPPPATPTKRSTRSKKSLIDTDSEVEQITEQPVILEVSENEEQEQITEIEETEAENQNDENFLIETVNEENYTVEEPQDEKSSSFPFGDIPSEITSSINEHSVDKEEVDNSFFPNLADEENANSLPSATEEVQDDSGEGEDLLQNTDAENNRIEIINEENNDIDGGDEEMEEVVNSEENAIAIDIPNGDNSNDTRPEPDTEMVSDDELPTAVKPEVQDAEEVSDEELPGPKLAELPADTEVVSEDELPDKKIIANTSKENVLNELPADIEIVSEDELPASKKNSTKRKADDIEYIEDDDGYDPSCPTDMNVSGRPEKKPKVDDSESKDKSDNETETKKKKLPQLESYWKAIKENSTDFTRWTQLLQYVDQEDDIEAAREAYDAFLADYPYCYGYWRKYADYEKKKGNKLICEEVFERGLKAIPLSVDLWIHYLSHVKTNNADDEEYIRTQFERAITSCGLEFRSDKLWEAYIKWETEGKRILKVIGVYDRLLATPTQGYNNHFDCFQEIVNNNPVNLLIGTEELKKLRAEVRESNDVKEKSNEEETETTEEPEAEDNLKNEEEIRAVKDKILSSRRKIHKATVAAVTERWTFEEGIKRPYFHVKPLEWCQLKNWKEYLDFEIEKGDRKRILVLFERCLIACALYDEYWLKLVRYLESQTGDGIEDLTRDAYERACKLHNPDKPSLHIMWSAFEELHDNFDKAAEILVNIEKTCPNLLQISYRRINVERRRKDFDKCIELYEFYINSAKNKQISSSLAIKYARFMHKIKGDIEGGLKVLENALEKDPSNARLALQMIDLALQRGEVNEIEVVKIMDNFMTREGMEPDQKVLFAQRKVEFLEDFGSTAKGLQDAQRALQVALSKANEAKKKQNETTAAKKATKESTTAAQSQSTAASYYTGSYGTSGQNSSNYYYGNNQSGYQGGYGDYSSSSWGQYPQSQSGYSGYQLSGYEYYNF